MSWVVIGLLFVAVFEVGLCVEYFRQRARRRRREELLDGGTR